MWRVAGSAQRDKDSFLKKKFRGCLLRSSKSLTKTNLGHGPTQTKAGRKT